MLDNNEETVMECQHGCVNHVNHVNTATLTPTCPQSEAEPPCPSEAHAQVVEPPPPPPPILVLPKGWIGPSEFGVFISLRYADGKFLNTEKALQLEGQTVHYFVLDRPYNNSGITQLFNAYTNLYYDLTLFRRASIVG